MCCSTTVGPFEREGAKEGAGTQVSLAGDLKLSLVTERARTQEELWCAVHVRQQLCQPSDRGGLRTLLHLLG
jgi:hypothetical protein